MLSEPWYSARCLFRHQSVGVGIPPYEERLVLFRAKDFDDALGQAESEAREYAASLRGVEFLGFIDIDHLCADSVGHKTEIFSQMRDTELPPSEFISRFFDTGLERSRAV